MDRASGLSNIEVLEDEDPAKLIVKKWPESREGNLKAKCGGRFMDGGGD